MKITDEMLSAFLDAALNDAEMEQVRQQLVVDEKLTDRLAALAMVDTLVLEHYEQINQQPVPDAIMRLLDEPVNNVVQFPWWRRAQQQLQQHAAAVACIALFAGYGLSQLSDSPDNVTAALNPDLMQILDNAPSGFASQLQADASVLPRLSFISQQGEFCRQYSLQHNSDSSENIACRRNGQWQLKARLITEPGAATGQYQTASAGSALDAVLDSLMAGPALNAMEEQQHLANDK
jgi:hypothetical protein